MISQFYVLSPRGDTIINRDFRGDMVKGTAEIFFRKVKFYTGDAPPTINIDGIHYIYMKRNGLYFVATTSQNVAPAYVLELLQRMTRAFKDFCGVLNEESVRKNFVLVYEILDEMLDFGYPQVTNTERLKEFVHNEAVLVEAPPVRAATGGGSGTLGSMGFPSFNPKTVPSHASHRPIGSTQGDAARKGRKNEIFVDILERLAVVMNSNGDVLTSSVEGSIQMKSYLTGTPELKLALNEDVVIRNTMGLSSEFEAVRGGGSLLVLDDCNFHECVDLNSFQEHRVMTLIPPDGEFVLMNYRVMVPDIPPPFRILPTVELVAPTKVELTVRIRADIPEGNYGGNVIVTCPMPKSATFAASELYPLAVPQTAEYSATDSRLVWSIKRLKGGSEVTLNARITLSQPLGHHGGEGRTEYAPANLNMMRKEMGPITINFEIPMFNVSNLQVRYLRIAERHRAYNPYRWVRYVTQSSSYVCRL